MSPLVIGIIIAVFLIVAVIVFMLMNNNTTLSNSPEDEQKKTLSKILEKFSFQNLPRPIFGSQSESRTICSNTDTTIKEKNFIDEYLKLVTSDTFYNSLKIPLPSFKTYFTKLSNLWEKIKSENGTNVNTTFFLSSYIVPSRQLLLPIYALNWVKENESTVPLETAILFFILMENFMFVYSPNNTKKQFPFSYNINTNKISVNDTLLKEIISKAKPDLNTDDKLNTYLNQMLGPKNLRDEATPNQWYIYVSNMFKQMFPNSSNLTEEQKQQSIQVPESKIQQINNLLNDSNFIKRFDSTNKDCVEIEFRI